MQEVASAEVGQGQPLCHESLPLHAVDETSFGLVSRRRQAASSFFLSGLFPPSGAQGPGGAAGGGYGAPAGGGYGAPGGAYGAPAGGGYGAPPGGGYGGYGGPQQPNAPPPGTPLLEYTAQNGATVSLNGSSQDACIEDCKTNPGLKSGASTSMFSKYSSAGMGGDSASIMDCVFFCREEFEMACFPGDSSVTERKRGRVCLSDLQLGDNVLTVVEDGRGAEDGGAETTDPNGALRHWRLEFEPVLAWLHRDPDADIEVLEIRHSRGQVRLTADHLLPIMRRGSGPAFLQAFAREVSVGDRLLSPWLDGSLVAPEVVAIERVRRQGRFSPLLHSGAIVVDNTAVSCYAIPEPLYTSPVFRGMCHFVGGTLLKAPGCAQSSRGSAAPAPRGGHGFGPAAAAGAHAACLPLRLWAAWSAAWQPQRVDKEGKEEATTEHLAKIKEATLHPYARVLLAMLLPAATT